MKSLVEMINEGLFSAFKIKSQLTKAQGEVFDYFEENVDKYNTVQAVERDLQHVAQEAYKNNVTEPDAPNFNEWFRDFKKSFIEYMKRVKA